MLKHQPLPKVKTPIYVSVGTIVKKALTNRNLARQAHLVIPQVRQKYLVRDGAKMLVYSDECLLFIVCFIICTCIVILFFVVFHRLVKSSLEKKVKSIRLRNMQMHHKIHSISILLPYYIHTMEIYHYSSKTTFIQELISRLIWSMI